MKFTINIPDEARMAVCNCMLPITHALVGKRRADFQRPAEELLTKRFDLLTPEEQNEVRDFNFNKKDKYSQHALGWVESEAEAEKLKQRFPEPEWDQESFVLVKAKCIVHYA